MMNNKELETKLLKILKDRKPFRAEYYYNWSEYRLEYVDWPGGTNFKIAVNLNTMFPRIIDGLYYLLDNEVRVSCSGPEIEGYIVDYAFNSVAVAKAVRTIRRDNKRKEAELVLKQAEHEASVIDKQIESALAAIDRFADDKERNQELFDYVYPPRGNNR